MLSEEEIAELERLEKAASEPWKAVCLDEITGPFFLISDGGKHISASGWDISTPMQIGNGECGAMTEADAKLAEAVRNALPRLLDAAEETARLKEERAEIFRIVDGTNKDGDPRPYVRAIIEANHQLHVAVRKLAADSARLRAEVAGLREAVEKAFFNPRLGKVWHKDFCIVRNIEEKRCDCGYFTIDAALAASAPKEEAKPLCDCPICHGEGFVGSDGETCTCIRSGCTMRHRRDEYMPKPSSAPKEEVRR